MDNMQFYVVAENDGSYTVRETTGQHSDVVSWHDDEVSASKHVDELYARQFRQNGLH
jgi:hypothetical protein